MPASTAGYKLPYPLGTDRVMDGDDQIRKLAQSVENMVQTGQVTIPITAPNTPASATWTFPVPFASATPTVLATLIAVGPLGRGVVVTVTNPTATSCVLNAQAASGSAGVQVFTLAVGPVTAVS